MFQSIRNIFAIKDLRQRIFFTLILAAVFRIGSHIPCPFISLEFMRETMGSGRGLGEGVFAVADMFTGGAFSRFTLFALGIMPYISASIILQILMVVVPQLQKKAKEGESGRRFINDITRKGTVALALVQGFGVGLFILQDPQQIAPFMREHRALFLLITMLSVTAGTTFLMWVGEKITEKGVGNGISLLIALGIMARYPADLRIAWISAKLGQFEQIWFLLIGLLCVGATIAIILIQEGQRKIPIQHAKQVVGRRMTQAQTNYLPMKVNTAGVMPVIFSSAVLTLPATLFGWIGMKSTGELGFMGEVFATQSRYNLYNMLGFIDQGSAFLLLKAANLHMLAFVVLTIAFSFFYTAIVFNPQEVADNLRRVGAFVPGYLPGKPTADYIDRVMSRITVVGAVFLVVVAITPQILGVAFNLPFQITEFAGGTGLIIVVAVVLDTMKQMESMMLMRHYEGFQSRRQAAGARRWAARES